MAVIGRYAVVEGRNTAAQGRWVAEVERRGMAAKGNYAAAVGGTCKDGRA